MLITVYVFIILSLENNLFFNLQDLDNETLLHIDAENRRQTLEEELEFLKSIHEQVRCYCELKQGLRRSKFAA